MLLKRNAAGLVGIGLCVAMGVSTVTGCASKTERMRSEARSAASDFRSSLGEMPGRIDKTMSSLMALTDNRSADKSRTLPDFKSDLAALDADARRLAKEADHATSDADAYFTQWTRDAVRTADAQKREEMERTMASRRGNYDTARSYLDSARRHYVDLTENLHDIERMYAKSGTESTQPMVRAAIEKAVQDSVYVKNYVARLGEQIDTTLGIK